MLLIFCSLVLSGVLSFMLLWYGTDGYDNRHVAAGVIGVIGAICVLMGFGFYAVSLWYWNAAEYKAKIINTEYHTNYTQEEIFYASNVIETIRQIDRKRYEVNGNLFNNQKNEYK